MNKGFSLIETLIAIVILISAVVGPLTLAQRSIRSAVYARDQVTAGFLAEEGIEFVRMIRDGNKLEGKNWLYSLSSDCIGGKVCSINTTLDEPRDAVNRCNDKDGPYGSLCLYLSFNSRKGFYGYPQRGEVGWSDTRYVREVKISTIPRSGNINDHEAMVTATVIWQTGDMPVRSVVVRDYIYDW
jgi:type II secretory pathway pseudopilin PulG